MTLNYRALRGVLCLGALMGMVLAGTARAQTPQAAPTDQHGMMMAHCQMMMKDMAANQQKIDDLVAKMNAATGQAKVDQMAALINELMAERKAMHAHMMSMDHGKMMNKGATPEETKPPAGHDHH